MNPDFDPLAQRYPSQRFPLYARGGMVNCSSPQAAAAGLEALRRGGNAMDAAVAAASALTVTEPTDNGLRPERQRPGSSAGRRGKGPGRGAGPGGAGPHLGLDARHRSRGRRRLGRADGALRPQESGRKPVGGGPLRPGGLSLRAESGRQLAEELCRLP